LKIEGNGRLRVFSIGTHALGAMLLFSGLMLWLPAFQGFTGSFGLQLVYVHVLSGFTLTVILGTLFFKHTRQCARGEAFGRAFFFSDLKSVFPYWIAAGISASVVILAFSGLLMIPGGRMPEGLLETGLFFHGFGILFLRPQRFVTV